MNTMIHQIKNIKREKEREIIKRNQIEILNLKSTITKMKNPLWDSTVYLSKEKKT